MSLLGKIKSVIHKQQFEPGFLGMFVNPFYFARKGLNEQITEMAGHLHGRLLDVGCGKKPYEHLFAVSEYIGLEYERGQIVEDDKADFYYDGKRFPFNDGEFDCLLSNEVLEHVFTPSEFLGEMNRVIKKDGLLLLTVPFLWAEHMQPFDYARYSSFGLRALLEEHGFEVVRHAKSVNDIRVLFQLLNCYIYRATESKNGKLNLLFCLLFMAPVNLAGQLCNWLLPQNDELYLDNIMLAKKIKSL